MGVKGHARNHSGDTLAMGFEHSSASEATSDQMLILGRLLVDSWIIISGLFMDCWWIVVTLSVVCCLIIVRGLSID